VSVVITSGIFAFKNGWASVSAAIFECGFEKCESLEVGPQNVRLTKK
jgi:hypothetical protein